MMSLRQFSMAAGSLLLLCAGCSAMNASTSAGEAAIIIDNADAQFEKSGTWNASVRDKPFIGENYLWSPKGSDSKARWSASSLKQGKYDVYVWFCASKDDDRATNAQYVVKHASGENTLQINQKPSAGKPHQWLHLGTWQFNGREAEYVELNNSVADHSVSADAVKFVPK